MSKARQFDLAGLVFIETGCGTRLSGDEGDRTPNPRLAKPVLSQLSYVPEIALTALCQRLT